jgi:protein ImuA
VGALSAAEIAALSRMRTARWRPGLADQPLHSEIFAGSADASGAGLALALARDALKVAAQAPNALAEAEDRRQVLWVQEARAIARSGRPYLHGLPPEWRERLIHVEAKSPADALFAIEEGLRCRDLACVIAEIMGNPRSLDFTASRRLGLAAHRHGIALWLVRLEADADLSAARMRWRVRPSASPRPHWNADAPGVPRWQAELFRARAHAPGQWTLLDDEIGLRLDETARAPAISQHAAIGPAFAARSRLKSRLAAAYSGDLVRQTVGRSLAACARA